MTDDFPTGVSRRTFVLTGAAAAAYAALPASAFAQVTPPRPAQSRDLTTLTLKQASDLVRRREVSAVALTEACLARIERYNPAINAFITVTRDEALRAARELDDEHRRGRRRGPLHGIPIALKDNIDTAGILTTAASGVFKDRVPAEDADVVVRLKQAGAVLLGKLNLHEFALGGTSAVTYFGPVRNPWDLDRVAGGSSGGSAAAVVADMCFGALGTDTGGSIRIPASLCGMVGLKPPELYQAATRSLIQGAGKVDAATYAQARRHVDTVRREVGHVFASVDVIVTPTQRGVAQPIAPAPPGAAGGRGAGAAPAGGGGGGIVNTAAFDIYGLPTITVPCGFSSAGLPIGLQISGNHFAESTVLAVAHAYERATEWHTRRPKMGSGVI